MTAFLEDYGLLVLFFIIAVQAMGVPGPPGKTALVVAAILAARGRFEIWHVIAVAAVASVAGGFLGYVIGRRGGQRLLEIDWLKRRFDRSFELARSFFNRHGNKAVFFARFVPGLKVIAALAAGSFGMRWPVFAFWHTLASIGFALVFGLTAFWAGEGAIKLIETYGVGAGVALAVLAVLAWLGWRAYRARRPRASTAN